MLVCDIAKHAVASWISTVQKQSMCKLFYPPDTKEQKMPGTSEKIKLSAKKMLRGKLGGYRMDLWL